VALGIGAEVQVQVMVPPGTDLPQGARVEIRDARGRRC
jgi:hypothetical protein